MSANRPSLPAKILALGLVGALLAMGLLLHTLEVVDDGPAAREEAPLSLLVFEDLLARGDVLECTHADGRLTGLKRGRHDRLEPFRVAGEIPRRLLRDIARRRVTLHDLSPAAPAPEPAAAR
ncbi:MAG: hypothetical protein JXQ29_07030 [Planctomycetes bacterium]|nr:hypothetical protein [Planctomycetota bacterium]